MTWGYKISTGEISQDGNVVARGYSGQPECKNDPSKCEIHNKGPIPPGRYAIGEPHDTKTHGPFVLPLTPDEANEMYGRSGFLIHGDSVVHPGTASEGCIILPRNTRNAISESGDTELEVIE